MVSMLRTAQGGKRGLISLWNHVFGNFTDRRVEVELCFVPLFKGCEKDNNVRSVREQSSVGEIKCILKDFV